MSKKFYPIYFIKSSYIFYEPHFNLITEIITNLITNLIIFYGQILVLKNLINNFYKTSTFSLKVNYHEIFRALLQHLK